jgi:hypothetical protein
MDSGMVSKIEKARRYAEEKDRVRFSQFEVTIRGGHADHLVRYDHGVFQCDCGFFAQRGVCSHTMAMERILTGMLVEGEPRPGDGGTEYQSTEVTS